MNLATILKDHIGESFYIEPFKSYFSLKLISDENLIFTANGIDVSIHQGKNKNNEIIVFPNTNTNAPADTIWTDWDVINNQKVKTWTDLSKNLYDALKPDFNLALDMSGNSHSESRGWTRHKTSIERSSLALMQILTLIDHCYGGRIPNFWWKHDNIKKYVIKPYKLQDEITYYIQEVDNNVSSMSLIAFKSKAIYQASRKYRPA